MLSFLWSVGFRSMFSHCMNPFLASNVKANVKDREKGPGIQLYRPNPLGRTPTNIPMEFFGFVFCFCKCVASWEKTNTWRGCVIRPAPGTKADLDGNQQSWPRESPGAKFWFGKVKTHSWKIFQSNYKGLPENSIEVTRTVLRKPARANQRLTGFWKDHCVFISKVVFEGISEVKDTYKENQHKVTWNKKEQKQKRPFLPPEVSWKEQSGVCLG